MEVSHWCCVEFAELAFSRGLWFHPKRRRAARTPKSAIPQLSWLGLRPILERDEQGTKIIAYAVSTE